MSGGGSRYLFYIGGYRYFMGMHQVLCHEADAVTGLMVGDKIAWTGSLMDSRLNIDQPTLFGGESSEGGIFGDIDLLSGSSAQGKNDYLVAHAESPQPAYRGVVSAVLRGFCVAIMNPYLKPWKWLVKRLSSQWRPSLAAPTGTQVVWDDNEGSDTYHTWITKTGVVTGKNPAHIIWEVLTSNGGTAQWGLGLATSEIDDATFTAAAQTLYDEGFGLNCVWASDTTVEDFLSNVLGYIDGVLFVHPSTGLWTLKLFRGNYDESALPILDESCVSNINTFVRTAYGELYNQIVVKWVQTNTVDGDVETNRTCIVQNLAAKEVQNGTNSKTIDCPYITNSTVAQKVAERYLRQLSFPLASVEIVGNRTLASIMPGDVIKLHWPDFGLDEMIFRVIKANYGELEDGKVTLSCTEDFYGLDATMFSGIGTSGWTNVTLGAEDAQVRYIEELPYYIAVHQYYTEEEIAAMDETSGAAAAYILRPTSPSLSYRLYEYSSADAKYVDRGSCAFTPSGLLDAALTQTTTSATINTVEDITTIVSGSAGLAQIDSELVLITGITFTDHTSTTATITMLRGVLDTTPKPHVSGSRMWFIGLYNFGLCPTIYLQSETAKLKACTVTSRETLALASASETDKTFAARMIRPYAPANVKINGSLYPTALANDTAITITWDNRNRLTQTGYVVAQSAGNIEPESGTTITIYLYDASGNLIKTITGLASNTRKWTYSLDEEFSDRGESGYGNRMRVEVESIRDGWVSWQRFVLEIPARAMSTKNITTQAGDNLLTQVSDALFTE